ncbi:MAG: FecR family protein [Elusimicrobiota bacterium]|nr:FecR family protein [Elusimicrobiota bacterium]
MKKILFLVLLSTFPPFYHSIYASGEIIFVAGEVKTNERNATQGSKIETGDIIASGSNSEAVVKLENGSVLNISQNSMVAVEETSSDNSVFKTILGKVKAKVQKLKTRQKFEIKTPTAICAVRGTEFQVEVFSDGKTAIEVYEGIVGARNIQGIGDEVAVYENQKSEVLLNKAPSSPESLKAEIQSIQRDPEKSEIKKEVGLQMTKEQVQSAAAEEIRLAEYQEGKTLIDVFGKRVRLEEYIMRPAADQFKLVVLNERDDRFDYFYYKGKFNKTLPADLNLALKDLNGKLGDTAPDYYLTEYEKAFSNTQDSSKDTSTGGHLVKITYNSNGTFTITDNDSAANTKIVNAADATNGAYDPVSDIFDSAKTTAQEINLYNPDNDKFETFSAGQTLWKTRFNSYEHAINGLRKQFYLRTDATKNVLASDLDGNWIYPAANSAGATIYGNWGVASTESTYPDGDVFHNRIKITYLDGTYELYDNYIISDDGRVANFSDFNNTTTGTEYKKELLMWNYQQVLTATEFSGRKIDDRRIAQPSCGYVRI